MSEFTPGPWKVLLTSDGQNCAGIVAESTLSADEEYIVETDSGFYGPELPDAHLIAAAPDLFAELERAHGMIRHYLKCGYLPHMSAEEAEQLVRNPDSAIRKAKGEL